LAEHEVSIRDEGIVVQTNRFEDAVGVVALSLLGGATVESPLRDAPEIAGEHSESMICAFVRRFTVGS